MMVGPRGFAPLRLSLCFGPYVEPGTEVYAVMGLQGCVTGR